MPKRTIKIKSFVWHKKDKDYNGDDITVVVQSKMGEVVDLPDSVVAYGEDMGAFVTPEDEAAQEDQATEVEDMDQEELIDWVSESNIPAIVKVAKANPEMVSTLLEAENAATGNDPRSGLVNGLARIVGSGELPEQAPAESDEDIDALAKRLGVDLSTVEGTGDEEAVTADDVKEYYDDELADATDGAVELAEKESVFLADVTGTGQDGRITKEDVQKFLDDKGAAQE